MRKFTKITYFLIFFFVFVALANAQNLKLTGKIIDKTNLPLPGVYVIATNIADTLDKHIITTNSYGFFNFYNLKPQSYKIKTSSLGYGVFEQTVLIKGSENDLGTITLSEKSQLITGVTIQGQSAPAVQKGDTTEMSANAVKTTIDANAEDLVKKMPGITIDNAGTVKAQGEDIKKVLVDGKPFFGDDPTLALRNLPAEVIDKVQVYSKLSEQAELTGFDDGNSVKTMNIITKTNRRNGQFGKATVGHDASDRYIASLNLNIFKNQQRISVVGLSNNVNQQNFSTQDFLGVTGNSGGRGGQGGARGGAGGAMGGAPSNFLIGQQNGTSTTNSIGINYSDTWGKKINISGSYFFNNNKNLSIQSNNIENLFTNVNTPKFSEASSNSKSINYNHRVNMRFEYQMDSLNTLIITPRISFQTNNSDKSSSTLNTNDGGLFYNSSNSTNDNNSNGYNLGNEILFRHKFSKNGRTFSIGVNTSATDKESGNTKRSMDKRSLIDSIPINTFTDGLTKGYTFSGNVTYTEPIGKFSILQFSYNASYSKNDANKQAYDTGLQNELFNRVDTLSNVFNNDYMTNRAGISYRIRNEKAMFTAGIDYQRADLTGEQTFPNASSVNKTFGNYLPNAMLTYKFSKKTNLRLNYRASTNAPSISQLQNVVDNSNSLLLSSGNPNLKQEYGQSLQSRFSFSDPEKLTNCFIFLSGGFTQNNLGYKTVSAGNLPVSIPELNYTLGSRTQMTFPVNLDYAYNLQSFISYSFRFKLIKSNITLLGGTSLSNMPGYINSILNRSNTYTLNDGIVIGSNISEKIDFTLSYNTIYNIVKNSTQDNSTGNANYNYWNHTGSVRINYTFWKGIVLQNDLIGQLNRGLSGTYNQEYIMWNFSMGKKLFKNQNGEIKLTAVDILNQNKNISRTVTPTYIQDSRNNVLGQYFLLSFTYNIRNGKGQMPDMGGDRRRDNFDRGDRGDRGGRQFNE